MHRAPPANAYNITHFSHFVKLARRTFRAESTLSRCQYCGRNLSNFLPETGEHSALPSGYGTKGMGCLLSAPKGRGKIARGFQPLGLSAHVDQGLEAPGY